MSDHRPGEGRRELPLNVLRYRDFRLIWSGEFVASLGAQLQVVALSWQIFDLTGSVALLGVLGLVRAAAIMSMALIGGALADLHDRRRVLIITNFILLALSAGLAAASAAGIVSVTMIYIVAAAAAVTAAFDSPARQALIPSLVPRERIPAAMSLNILTGNVADVIGPALGGFAIAFLGVAAAYALNAASFVFVIGAVLLMRARPEIYLQRTGGMAAIREGLRFIWATPVIYGVMLLDFLATLFGSRSGLAPVFAEDVLNIGPQGLGILLSAPAAGAILAGTALSVMAPPRRPGWTIVGAIVAYGLSLALFGLSSTVWMAVLFLGFSGAADAVSMTMRHTIRNLATPDRLRGRIAAAHSAFSSGGPYLGDFQSGMTAALIGPRGAMVFGGLACVGVAFGVALLIPAVLAYRFTDSEAESEPLATG